MTARESPAGYDPHCLLPRPHGHHWNGLGQGAEGERECHGEPHAGTAGPAQQKETP